MDAILVAAVERGLGAHELQALDPSLWLEVHAHGSVPDTDPVRAHFGGRLLFNLRSGVARAELLRQAAASYDFICLEPGDLGTALLDVIPPERRVISCFVAAGDDIDAKVRAILATPAILYRVVVESTNYAGTLRPLRLLKSLGRRDVIAFANGPLGMWTRVLAPHLGAPFVFAKLDGDVATDGTPTLAQLRTDYGLPQFTEVDEIFGIAGDPVFPSLSRGCTTRPFAPWGGGRSTSRFTSRPSTTSGRG